jgi:hypothetical protein
MFFIFLMFFIWVAPVKAPPWVWLSHTANNPLYMGCLLRGVYYPLFKDGLISRGFKQQLKFMALILINIRHRRQPRLGTPFF